MSLKSLSFGISKYVFLSKTDYADNDAIGFNGAIKDFFSPAITSIYTDDKLSKTLLLKWFKEFVSDLTENDTFYFFYAGHGCNYKNKAYLSCFDSLKDDIDTWISLEELFDIVASTKCKKVLFFIDACQDNFDHTNNRGELSDKLDIRENLQFQDENNFRLTLFSSSEGERANVKESSKHGIWSYYLIKALRAEDEGRDALSEDYNLYLNRLQEYLHTSVKKYYRGINKVPKQSSTLSGSMNLDILLTSFSAPYMEKYEGVPIEVIPNIQFETIIDESVKKLDGFDKKNRNHKVPKWYSVTTCDWIHEIGNDNIQKIMDRDSARLVDLFELDPSAEIEDEGYKLENSNNSGRCSFKCKYFEYTITIDLDENDLSNAILRIELQPLDQDKLFQVSSDLDSCFSHWFDSMVMYRGGGDVKTICGTIKKFEKKGELPFTYNYAPTSNELEIQFEDGRRFKILEDVVRIDFRAREPLDEMLDSLADLSNVMLEIDSNTRLLDV